MSNALNIFTLPSQRRNLFRRLFISQGKQLIPPPWLIAMQRYGPPPSYPNLKIPGLNAGIPEVSEGLVTIKIGTRFVDFENLLHFLKIFQISYEIFNDFI